jgi:3',5'-cyclic AMP phosphodiesterase CpdA
MRIVIHLSDLHFGRADPVIVHPLLDFIRATKPDLVAVSGDLTQRAHTEQFLEARNFLDAIPFPKIVVPGNHDVPLYNVFARLFRMLDKFRRFISEDLEPFYVDNEIAVSGVNTARALTGKNGRINRQQLERLRARFATVLPTHVKIVVTHHPFDLPPGVEGDRVVLRAESAMKSLAQIPVDMLLAGHFHVAGTTRTATRYKIDNFSALIVASGTTISTRGRGQPNSLNVIRIETSTITIAQHQWRTQTGAFDLFSTERFVLRFKGSWNEVKGKLKQSTRSSLTTT